MTGLTPMMQQYIQIKEQHKDAILFFRLGDFYEMFFDDAIIASKDLEITLTGKDCGLEERAPMCGVPFHSAEGYIAKLIEKGHKVAICEQTQDPAEAKGLVERQVVRVVTPGTILETSMLDDKSNNYLVSVSIVDQNSLGMAFADISTGEFFVCQLSKGNTLDKLLDELSRLNPSEILFNDEVQADKSLINMIRSRFSSYITFYHQWAYQYESAYKKLLSHFKVQSLVGYGCEDMEHGISAAGALLEYLSETQKNTLEYINQIKAYFPQNFMVLDNTARRNLELIETIRGKGKRGSLLWLLDKTNTAMGGRLLRKWVQQPLIEKNEIVKRQDVLQELINNPILMEDLRSHLEKVYDLERLISRISFGSGNARDMLSLKQSLEVLPPIKELLKSAASQLFEYFYSEIDILEDVYTLLENSIFETPPTTLKEGNIIKSGYNVKLDDYRHAMTEGKDWIAALEQQEREKTGIKNLKIGFNKIFGYYIDITKSYYDLVPTSYIRKQTLANSERYITDELKEVEDKILGAEDKSIRLEYDIFCEIREQVAGHADRIQKTAAVLAALDALYSLAKVSFENGYIRPSIHENGILSIKDGRHPVVEKTLPHGLFVPNDTNLSSREHLMIITGPNMAGKSTYMRQVALIVLMAQIGCFVPAKEAEIGIVDRIFTRVGASDDLSSGQSTFMVEMNEVANILNNATSKSLLVLDEIGRGTSTFDGLSIAWAVIEHICQEPLLKSKTLFATHYHELTELEGQIKGIQNYCIAVKEQGDDIIFLRRIIRGGADKSFGVQVAKLAGLPTEVINRAKKILALLEEADINNSNSLMVSETAVAAKKDDMQISFFQPEPSAIEQELKTLDIVNITPMEAMKILYELVQKARG